MRLASVLDWVAFGETITDIIVGMCNMIHTKILYNANNTPLTRCTHTNAAGFKLSFHSIARKRLLERFSLLFIIP